MIPRVLPNQKERFETEEIFKRNAQTSEASKHFLTYSEIKVYFYFCCKHLNFFCREKQLLCHLNSYFNCHVCLSIPFRPCECVCPKLTPFSAVGSKHVTKKSFLVCVKREKCAFWVNLRSLGSTRQEQAEFQAL